MEQDAKKILRHNVLWGNGLAELLRAGAAAVRQDRSDALAFLRSACKSCGAADMELYAAAGRCAQGQLIGGNEGRAMIESAEAWMKHQGIRNSARIVAMLVPGFELCAAKPGPSNESTFSTAPST